MSYSMKYDLKVECGKFEKSDAKKVDVGLCDGIIVTSVIQDGGALSFLTFSKNGLTGDAFTDHTMLMLWGVMASDLKDAEEIRPEIREIIQQAFTSLKEFAGKPTNPQ